MADTKPKIAGTATHPYVATITLDPADYSRFCELLEDKPEVTILDTDRSAPDLWTIYVGCASRSVADLLEIGW